MFMSTLQIANYCKNYVLLFYLLKYASAVQTMLAVNITVLKTIILEVLFAVRD